MGAKTMLYQDQDQLTGITTYMVCNNQGLCLIRTTSSRIANFIDQYTVKLDPSLRLLIGGDPGSRELSKPLFHHIRRITTR